MGPLHCGSKKSDHIYFTPIRLVVDDIEKFTGKQVEMYCGREVSLGPCEEFGDSVRSNIISHMVELIIRYKLDCPLCPRSKSFDRKATSQL